MAIIKPSLQWTSIVAKFLVKLDTVEKPFKQTRVFLEIPCLLLECNVWSGLNQHSLAKIHIGSAFLYTHALSLFFVGTYILLLSLVPSWMRTPTLSVSLPTPWNRFTHTHTHALPHSLSLSSSRLVSLFHFLQTDTHSLALSSSVCQSVSLAAAAAAGSGGHAARFHEPSAFWRISEAPKLKILPFFFKQVNN